MQAKWAEFGCPLANYVASTSIQTGLGKELHSTRMYYTVLGAHSVLMANLTVIGGEASASIGKNGSHFSV